MPHAPPTPLEVSLPARGSSSPDTGSPIFLTCHSVDYAIDTPAEDKLDSYRLDYTYRYGKGVDYNSIDTEGYCVEQRTAQKSSGQH